MKQSNIRTVFFTVMTAFAAFVYVTPGVGAANIKAYKNITLNQFLSLMDNKDFFLVNVHIPYQGEIPKTDISIPYNAIEQYKNMLPEDKHTKIIVYCMGGYMGNIAAEKLVRMGYTRVFNFVGGMNAWMKIGKSLEKDKTY